MNHEPEIEDASKRERRRYYNPEQKDYATFLQTSQETGGERTLIEIEVAPEGGPPPHYHKTYDEHFEVLEGTLEVLLGKEKHILHPGQKAVAPKNTLHRFKNPTDEPTTFLVEMRPGQPGFEKALMAGYGLASDGRDPTHHPYQLAIILEWSEIRLGGVMGLLDPVFRLLARRARRKGVDKELEAEYCR
jgi:quercetin dioxygenase-like cupin family protein